MTRFEKTGSPLLPIAISMSMAGVFWADLVTQHGIAVWVLYLIPLALSLFGWRPRTPLIVGAAATAFILLGFFVAPQAPSGFPPIVGRVNRSVGIVTTWAIALMARQFVMSRLELREQDWIRAGQRDLGLRTQGDHPLAEVGEKILRFLCGYLEAPVGVLYVSDDAGTFRRTAAYALAPGRAAPETVAPGEGVVGQAIRENRLLHLRELPADFLPVASALGRARPPEVVVLPACVDGAVLAVLELGFLHPVGRSDLDLLDAISEPIAVALRSARFRTRLQELLEETQRQAEELQAQQEELRVANEELDERNRALQATQSSLENQQAELEQTNARLEEQTHALQLQRDDLRRAQVELVTKAEELARANQYKSEFLANMSHELRTPLNSALVLSKLLADNRAGNLTPDQVKQASTIYSAGNDLLTLINDILDLSRIEAGRMELNPEPVTLARVLERLELTFRPLANQRGLTLALELEERTPASMVTDSLRLQQILRNLLSNAIKFTERGGVWLRVAPVAPERVAFVVRDTGIGVAPEQQEVIFEAFRQANGGAHRRFGGTGLGLTISRELARRLGGELTVESEPGRGSAFTLVLPLALPSGKATPAPVEAPASAPGNALAPAPGDPPAPAPTSPAAAPSSPAASPAPAPAVPDDRDRLAPGARSVLIIEDDVAFAAILRDLARGKRFGCLVATSAREGLELARRFAPSAILLDVQLPDQSGLVLLEQLKRGAATRHIPVHVISIEDHTQQALELGAIGYAVKPIVGEQLVGVFESLERRLEQKIRRVLVVEDTAAQRESIVQLLQNGNVEVVPASTGGEALEQLRTHTFDCMVLDLTLPDMSGYEVLDRMAAGEAFSFPPVIVYTGHSLLRDDELRLRRYANSIIVKGARSPERLLDEVTLFLHQVEANLPDRQQRILREVRNREAALEGKSILVVDDDVRNVFALASLLEPKGARLRIARNGKEALAALDAAATSPEAGVDLVLMDVMMPEMDGLTATREIRKRAACRELPIIALTAKAMASDRAACLEAGASDYIAKPIDVEKLLSLIKVWMPK